MLEVSDQWQDVAAPPDYCVNSVAVQRDLITVHADEPVRLTLRLLPNLLNRLTENPLTKDQVLTQDERGSVLNCRILDTQGLRLFLLSNAVEIEVLAPAYLRAHVRNRLQAAVAMYDNKE